ncbi:MAG: hypothetical protein HZC17_09655 [Candidatus Omnitrophica bacterium]|nr:hypothetical protein [Candidatus Omnitrophota bacterium]
MNKKFIGLVMCLCLISFSTAKADDAALPEAAQAQASESQKPNPVLDAPAGVAKFLYGGFQGFGHLFDNFLTGDRAPAGSLKGKEDPLPITHFEGRYNQLQQVDYGSKSLNDFAKTDSSKKNLPSQS